MILYSTYQKVLLEDMDEFLLEKVSDVNSSIKAYWSFKSKHLANRSSMMDNPKFLSTVQEWIEYQSDDLGFMSTIVEIYDPDGKVLVTSKYLENPLSIPPKTLEKMKFGKKHYNHIDLTSYASDIATLRTLIFPIIENNKLVYIIQVGHSLNAIQKDLKKLAIILLLILPLTVLIAGVTTGRFMANVILAPLKKLSLTTSQISTSNLDLRMDIPKTDDEISQLAKTFNQMLDELQKSFLTQTHFLQNCSHELRTPLTILMGEIELTLDRNTSATELERVLKSNLKEMKRLHRLVEDLLTISRMEGSDFRFEFVQTSLTSLLRDLLEDWKLLAPQYPKYKLALTFDLPEKEIFSHISPDKFIRVIINLLDNAFKYNKQDGSGKVHVVVTNESFDNPLNNSLNKSLYNFLDDASKTVLIEIIDTGIGIIDTNIPHIFERFFREKRSDTEGFGLGLAMAHSIITAHRGTIGVKKNENEGITIWIRLPQFSASFQEVKRS